MNLPAAAVRAWRGLNALLIRLDGKSLWWIGLILTAVAFAPILLLGQGSVFEIHDQLDETLLTYVLNAKYLFTGTEVFPEMLGGVNASGMQPSAVLFIPLYRIFPVFTAFVLQYLTVFLCGFFGMYLSVKELTGSSLLSVAAGGLFCMLPVQPVYGLSVLGVPLLIYGFLCLYRRKRVWAALAVTVFFGLTTHLVLIGYAVLTFWGLAALLLIVRRKHNAWVYGGFCALTGVYLAVNRSLFLELIFGGSDYVSHREELVNYASPFMKTVTELFLESGQHAPSLHRYLMPVIALLFIIEGIRYGRMDEKRRGLFRLAEGILIAIVLIAVFCGVCRSEPVVSWKNSCGGFLRYFQAERYYWLYPSLWYLLAALLLYLLWTERARYFAPVWKLLVIAALLMPTVSLVKVNSQLYRSVNQLNNGSGVTGYISWESYYAGDLMQKLEETIGRDKTTYRVAHLGISPAPALMYGFYTIDGYSNNYPLAYKHSFREIIAEELGQDEQVQKYFDEWGSRCYLFNGKSGMYWMLSKEDNAKYEGLKLDTRRMRELGCEYLFSGGEILNPEELGLAPMGYFETPESYWGIWLYQLRESP